MRTSIKPHSAAAVPRRRRHSVKINFDKNSDKIFLENLTLPSFSLPASTSTFDASRTN